MTMLYDLLPLLVFAGAWVQTPDGTNLLFAAICAASLLGLPARLCLGVTLALHLVLVLL